MDYEAGAELGLVLWLPSPTRQPGGLRGHDVAGVGIEQRPPEADGTRFGDWELDLMSDAEGKNFKLTLV